MNNFLNFGKYLKRGAAVLYKFFPYLWGEKKEFRILFIAAFVFVFLGMLLNIGIPLLLKHVVNSLQATETSYYVISILVCYGVLWILSQVVNSFREICMFRVVERGTRRVNTRFMEHLNNLSMSFHSKRKTGDLVNALERSQAALPIVFYSFILITSTVLEIFIAASLLWGLYGFIYGLLLVGILIAFVVFNVTGTRRLLDYRRISNKANRKATSRLIEALLNFEVIRYFGNQQLELAAYDNVLGQKENAEVKSLVSMAMLHIIHTLILGAGFLVLILMVGFQIMAGKMGVGDFILVNGLVLQFFLPLSTFGDAFRGTYRAVTDMEHVSDILDIVSEVQDALHAPPINVEKGAISFKNVSFGYEPSRLVLKNISFDIPPGKTVAIVGTSGGGKSTIAKLLYRFYDVQEGEILIDGQNIKEVQQESLAKTVGIVPQDTILFNNTISYNMAYGNFNASSEEIKEAAKAAQVDKFVNVLPDEYNTVVGERGLNLSGGEKQRIAIARVLLKNPDIYIFDHATSALDMETEASIQQSVNQVSKGKTTLIISHRLSMVAEVDEIFVLEDGQIQDHGTHEELIKKNSRYSTLFTG